MLVVCTGNKNVIFKVRHVIYFSCVQHQNNTLRTLDIETHCGPVVNMGSDNCLFSVGTKPLPEPILTCHQLDLIKHNLIPRETIFKDI